MGDETPVEELVKEGKQFFDQSNLKQAEAKAREALRRDSINRDAQRLLVYTLFEQQHFLEAEPFFLTLKDAYSPAYDQHQEAQWHLLLCYRVLSADAVQRALYEEELSQVLKNTKHLHRAEALRMKAESAKGR